MFQVVDEYVVSELCAAVASPEMSPSVFTQTHPVETPENVSSKGGSVKSEPLFQREEADYP